MKPIPALYDTINRLSPISDEVWTDFSQYWIPTHLKKADFIIRTGSVERYFYFVEEGAVRAYILKDGQEVCIGFSYNGDFSGAYDSFLAQSVTDINIQAISDASLWKISYRHLMAMFDRYQSLERWGRLFNAEMLIGMARRQVEVRAYSAEERFNRLVGQSPQVLRWVPQKYLASYLGMTPETFSRLRKKAAS